MRSSTEITRVRPAAVLLLALFGLTPWHEVGAAGRSAPQNVLDPTFGSGGIVVTDLPSSDEQVTDLALQEDGRILAIGTTDLRSVIVRYLPDGQVDPEFPSTPLTFGDQIAVQNDGKIIVAGEVGPFGGSRFALERLNADGTIDSTFGQQGKVVTPFTTGADLEGVAIQSDGMILAAGSATRSDVVEGFLFARYRPSGRLDSSFGSNGKVITTLASKQHDLGDVTIQDDGKIVANGTLLGPTTNRLGLVRLEPDGTLDPTFGGTGQVVVTEIDWLTASGLAVQPDGALISGVQHFGEQGNEFAVTRHFPDGTLDSGFGDAGLAHTLFNGLSDEPEDVAVQPNGLIVQGGWSPDEGDENDLAVVWYRSDGSVYSQQNPTLWGLASFGFAVTVQPDGKAIVAGSGGSSFDQERFGLARFMPN